VITSCYVNDTFLTLGHLSGDAEEFHLWLPKFYGNMLHPFLRHALVALFLKQGDMARWIDAEWGPSVVVGKEKKRNVCFRLIL
jgi:hypothetical protein